MPPSQRDRWFDALEAMGVDPADGLIPAPFRSGVWRGAVAVPAPPRAGGSIEGRYMDFFGPPDDGED